jgi:hypothetical protein
MPRNPEQDQDRPDDLAQGQDQSQAKVWPKNPDQQDKAGDRQTNTDESSPENANRVPGKDERVEGEDNSREDDDEEIAKKMSRSGQGDRSTGSGG